MDEIDKQGVVGYLHTVTKIADYFGRTARSYQKIESGEICCNVFGWDALEDLFKVHQRELRQDTL